MYHIAHGTALCEYLITLWFRPAWKTHSYATEIGTLLFSPLYEVLTETRAGIVFVIIGQALRSMAMIHAATNFSHAIAWKKLETHKLVTDGIYACVVLAISFETSCSLPSNRWFRHPSYTGFFYWALGTQLVLQNTVSFLFFLVVLWRFFSARIRGTLIRLK